MISIWIATIQDQIGHYQITKKRRTTKSKDIWLFFFCPHKKSMKKQKTRNK